jgi:antitoxin component YwqK of YwqJK toxin-antitoxin module
MSSTKRVPVSELSYNEEDDRRSYASLLFTGVAYFLAKDGQLMYECEYRDGRKWGRAWEKYVNGTLYLERHYFDGLLHGEQREWHEDGRLAEEGLWEFGICLSSKKYDQEGVLQSTFLLTPSHALYRCLLQQRELYGSERMPTPE